jgi:hypothetical protein
MVLPQLLSPNSSSEKESPVITQKRHEIASNGSHPIAALTPATPLILHAYNDTQSKSVVVLLGQMLLGSLREVVDYDDTSDEATATQARVST